MKQNIYPCELGEVDAKILSQLKDYAAPFGIKFSTSELMRLCIRIAGPRLLSGEETFIPSPARTKREGNGGII
jgi:hypothetical protein